MPLYSLYLILVWILAIFYFIKKQQLSKISYFFDQLERYSNASCIHYCLVPTNDPRFARLQFTEPSKKSRQVETEDLDPDNVSAFWQQTCLVSESEYSFTVIVMHFVKTSYQQDLFQDSADLSRITRIICFPKTDIFLFFLIRNDRYLEIYWNKSHSVFFLQVQ